MAKHKVTLPITSLRPYIQRANIFVSRAKLGINPIFGSLMLLGDKGYVFNGESGVIMNLPFSVPQKTVISMTEMKRASLDKARDDSTVELEFDYVANTVTIKTHIIQVRIRLTNPDLMALPTIPQDTTPVAVENFLSSLRDASFTMSPDASIPHLQGVMFTRTSVCATDQRGVWRQSNTSDTPMFVPEILVDHIRKLGVEPTEVRLNAGQLFVYYQDMIVFGSRLADETKFPNVDGLFESLAEKEDAAEVVFDRETFKLKFEAFKELESDKESVVFKCTGNVLSLRNPVTDKEANTIGDAVMDVQSSADFDEIRVSNLLLERSIEKFNRMTLKADLKRVVFHNDTQQYAVILRAVAN